MADRRFYTAPLDGKRVLWIGGDRLAARSYPRTFGRVSTPRERCPVCRHGDAWQWIDLGDGEKLHVGANPHALADRAHLAWIRDHHDLSFAELPAAALGGLIVWSAIGPEDGGSTDPAGSEYANAANIAFANVGNLGGQSHRHPHTQIMRFRELLSVFSDPTGFEADWNAAGAGGSALEFESLRVRIPRRPTLTCEAWIELPATYRDLRRTGRYAELGRDLGLLLRGVESTLTDSMNLAFLSARLDERAVDFVRVIPRGLAEPSGAELTYPGVFAFNVATQEQSVGRWATVIECAKGLCVASQGR